MKSLLMMSRDIGLRLFEGFLHAAMYGFCTYEGAMHMIYIHHIYAASKKGVPCVLLSTKKI